MRDFVALLQTADCRRRIFGNLGNINGHIGGIVKCNHADSDFFTVHFVLVDAVFRGGQIATVFVAQALGITAGKFGVQQAVIDFAVIIVADNIVQFRNGRIQF